MPKYVDFKVTIWNRAVFREDTDMAKIVDCIKNNLIDDIYDEENGFDEYLSLLETEEAMTVKENNNQATLEVIVDGRTIWDNSDGPSPDGSATT